MVSETVKMGGVPVNGSWTITVAELVVIDTNDGWLGWLSIFFVRSWN